LRIIRGLMTDEDYQLGNADITIIAESPKMAPYLDSMKKNLTLDLDADISRLNIKATTTEKLGFPGRKEGIAVHAVVLLEKLP
jgi:2-C-methyl-D-erythritol 2,4-cyclodiphosphate synthase